jgi:hypothetical protein
LAQEVDAPVIVSREGSWDIVNEPVGFPDKTSLTGLAIQRAELIPSLEDSTSGPSSAVLATTADDSQSVRRRREISTPISGTDRQIAVRPQNLIKRSS